jgi:pimeloyl-ACP methyl ester carboxylesterase
MTSAVVLKKVHLPNEETLGYRECGSGDKILLLIHGNMTSSKHWDLLMENIPDIFKVYAIDLRGFGISTYNNSISSIKDFSDDIKLFVDALKIDTFTIMGWSMGAAVAMQFAIDYSSRVENLILMSGASIKGIQIYNNPLCTMVLNSQFGFEKMFSQFLSEFKTANKIYFKNLWDIMVYNHNKPSEDRYTEYLDDMVTQKNMLDCNHALSVFNISNDFNGAVNGNSDVKKIEVPTLIIHGDRDKIVPIETAFENKEAIGVNARLEILRDCGHSPLIDKLDDLISLLVYFLYKK